jgi:hypothetical protein
LFNPRRTSALVLAMIIALGALYSPLESSIELAYIIGEFVKDACCHMVRIPVLVVYTIKLQMEVDNRTARSVSVWQAILLWTQLKWSGSRR